MKPMIYVKRGIYPLIILEENTYKGFKFRVVSYGTHPCAYVEVTNTIYDECDLWNQLRDDDKREFNYNNYKINRPKRDLIKSQIECHGGITFSEPYLPGDDLKSFKIKDKATKWYIGWDYHHFGDFDHKFNYSGTKYTTEEIVDECKSVIDQIIKFNEESR